MISKKETLLAELGTIIAEVSHLSDRDGVGTEQRKNVLAVLGEYAACFTGDPPRATDFNRVARIVVEYWPTNLLAGEHAISIEQKLRTFFSQRK
ncbi:hypothetical protein [Paraburkholderia sp.]|uniref:hypothetical protein n=1 Tax=Paraburkholderia sp. TaxID=1926495 RepID=UPI003D6E0BAD